MTKKTGTANNVITNMKTLILGEKVEPWEVIREEQLENVINELG